MPNTCEEEKGLRQRQAKMLHLLSDNYLIPTLLLSALAFDLLRVSMQDKHKITGESNEFKSPILYCYMCNQGISLLPCSLLQCSFSLPIIDPLTLVIYLPFVCVCMHAYMPLDTFASDYGHDSDASGTGCVSQCQLHIFSKSRFASVFQRAPSLVNRTRICRKETELHL